MYHVNINGPQNKIEVINALALLLSDPGKSNILDTKAYTSWNGYSIYITYGHVFKKYFPNHLQPILEGIEVEILDQEKVVGKFRIFPPELNQLNDGQYHLIISIKVVGGGMIKFIPYY